MIGSFMINVHMKKSVRPNLHYMSNIISLTWLVFKLLSEQQKLAEYVLCNFTTILVAQQIVAVCSER